MRLYTSFTYPDRAGWKLDGTHLTFTKIGSIRLKLHRPIEGKIKTATIKYEAGPWYAELDRDVSAAINILERGRKGLTQASGGTFRRGIA